MDRNAPSTESRAQHLIEAIEQVGEDCWRIDVWAGALARFAALVPVYEPGDWSRSLVPRRAAAPAE
jgi:hypothetical protein